ncbi:4-hydroxyphenylacetate 3-hydroxylase family protein [Xenorhabdus griffiniae]|uniref:4-hydroxyphenylacetate 3-hydroxylase family protein n=1 Tax=Xenorhabdus griffiniae TaxID=351672 RepID=UPI0023588414|nr:4-hydroxyphenylacetate 3-hydroxylase N-terminal domain-containing protein [Xenorhabdus griffiniae]MDC9607146.1 4-hydroxyphenylacetate 3-hydroxylase N-terminal domain-containing protein [Xenorhabdus griffiniae]
MLKENYLRRLKVPRQVYIDSRLVTDVSNETSFQGAINSIAQYYHLQESQPDIFTYQENGVAYHISTLAPSNHEDLKRKRESYKAVADLSFGMLGRTPDFINCALAAMARNAHVLGSGQFADFSDNAVRYYEKCRRNHLFIGHGAVNPQIDRGISLGSQENSYCGVRVVSSDEKGIIVSGAKMIVTLAPIADELLVFNMPGLVPGDEDYAIAFAVPVTAAGVKLICRKSLQHADYSLFDHPVANLFDESDAYMVFDDVFIPWSDVFVFRDVEKSNAFYDKTRIRNHNGHQGIVRGLSKAELLTGVAIELAEKMGLTGFLNVREQLGEMTSCLELVRGAILLAEQDAIYENDLLNPSIHAIQAVRYHFPKWYQRMVNIIQSLSAGSMLAVPHQGDFSNENAPVIRESLRTTSLNASDRCFLLNLAWDLSGDGFGQRQMVYEKYHAGDPIRIAAMHYATYPKDGIFQHLNNIKRIYRDSLCEPSIY